MDSIRFGRALGVGARSAAKALAAAADAATSPNPTPVSRPTPGPVPGPTRRPSPARPIADAAQTVARATVQARRTSEGIARGGKRFGGAMWGPLVKISGVLWLEITGSFFGLFFLFAGQAAWTHRVDLRTTNNNHDAHLREVAFLAMAVVFGYFCISSFVRARRRERSS